MLIFLKIPVLPTPTFLRQRSAIHSATASTHNFSVPCPGTDKVQVQQDRQDSAVTLFPQNPISKDICVLVSKPKEQGYPFGSKGISDSVRLIWATQWVWGKPRRHRKPQNKYWGGKKKKEDNYSRVMSLSLFLFCVKEGQIQSFPQNFTANGSPSD